MEDFKNFLLENGYLSERKDDNSFRMKIFEIIQHIISKYEQTPDQNPLFLNDYELFIYIINDKNESKGFFSRIKENKTPVIVLNVYGNENLENNYLNKNYFEIIKNSENVLLHELVHYLRYLKTKPDIVYYDKSRPFNNPQEFDAYFHQISTYFEKLIVSIIKNGNSFDTTFGENVNKFISIFLNKLDDLNPDIKKDFETHKTYNYKWKKRIYQLYYELKEMYNKYKFIKLTETIKEF